MSKAMYYAVFMIWSMILYVPMSWIGPAWWASLILIYSVVNAVFMTIFAFKEWAAEDPEGLIVLEAGMWLCPHCMETGKPVILNPNNSTEREYMLSDHLWAFHPDIAEQKLLGL